jgi:hypothetical protein
MAHERTPKNAHGSFCVFKDECISCRAKIEAEAPGLMAYDEDHSSCFFERQPTTPEEEYRAIRAVWASCCGAVRYGVLTRVTIPLSSLPPGARTGSDRPARGGNCSSPPTAQLLVEEVNVVADAALVEELIKVLVVDSM